MASTSPVSPSGSCHAVITTSNHLDIESDGDGVVDLVEASGIDLNGDGQVDAWTNSDGDGVVDSVDVDSTGGLDTDGDGIDDFFDASFIMAEDSDDDGIFDMFDTDFLGTGYLPFVNAIFLEI